MRVTKTLIGDFRTTWGYPHCRMIDIRQDGVEPGAPWLRSLARERDRYLAVYADVSEPGQINRGDRAQPLTTDPRRPSGYRLGHAGPLGPSR